MPGRPNPPVCLGGGWDKELEIAMGFVPDICLVLTACVGPCHVTQHSSMSLPHPSSLATRPSLPSALPSSTGR